MVWIVTGFSQWTDLDVKELWNQENCVLIMKNGAVFKNTLEGPSND